MQHKKCQRETSGGQTSGGNPAISRHDLYYLHWVDVNVPIEEVAGTMKELMQQSYA